MVAMIGRVHHVVLDCPDPLALATFWSALLGLPVTYRDDDWVVVAASETTSGLAFQLAPDHRPPTWPDPAVPQQLHLEIMVEDPAAAGPRVLALGAARLDGEDVYADPAGHPFCLIRRPRWAPRIPEDAAEPGTALSWTRTEPALTTRRTSWPMDWSCRRVPVRRSRARR
jgi:catechol 2,3-dioxygenase-like lactoylglutathione lyase family enzyme